MEGNPTGGCPVVPRAWTTDISVSTMGWCCDFPLANGSCSSGFEINVQAGTVVTNTSATMSGNASPAVTGSGSKPCRSNSRNEVAIGVGIGVPALIAVVSLAFLRLRERQRRRNWDGVAAVPLKSKLGGLEGMELMSGAEGRPGKPEMDGTPHRGELP